MPLHYLTMFNALENEAIKPALPKPDLKISQDTGISLSIVNSLLKAQNMPHGMDCLTDFWFTCPIDL